VALAAAIELLNALLRYPHQIAVMPMRVVSVAFKMRTNRLDAGLIVLLEVDPVGGAHGFPPKHCLAATVSSSCGEKAGRFVQCARPIQSMRSKKVRPRHSPLIRISSSCLPA